MRLFGRNDTEDIMSDDAKNWQELEAKLRKALGLAPPSAAEADAEMENAEGVHMSREEIERLVERAMRGEKPEPSLAADYSWLKWVPLARSDEFVFNRNRTGASQGDSSQGIDIQRRVEKAEAAAEELVENLGIKAPVDPFAIAENESPVLHMQLHDFGSRFDGQLEFDQLHREFLMLVNTKYDATWPRGGHHPRTRFSAAHELGHYFLDHHRARLLRGGEPQPSHVDFTSALVLEREADHFASALLMPRAQFLEKVKRLPVGLPAIRGAAEHFGASLTSAAIRYAGVNAAPVVVIKWASDGFGWKWLSNAAYEAGLRKTIEDTKEVPGDSATGKVLAGRVPTGQSIEQGTTAAAWFPFVSHGSSRNDILIEQAISLGEHGLLTVLSPQGGTFSYSPIR